MPQINKNLSTIIIVNLLLQQTNQTKNKPTKNNIIISNLNFITSFYY